VSADLLPLKPMSLLAIPDHAPARKRCRRSLE
jgi:hypothetical protein